MPRVTRDANESSEYKPLPNGSYHLKVEACEQKTDADKDKDQLSVKCAVQGGPHGGKVATLWFSMKPQAIWKLRLFMDSAGIPYEEIETDRTDAEGKPVTSITFDTEEFPGAELMADATFDEKFNNNKWQQFRPAPGAAAPQQAAAPAQGADGGEQQQQTPQGAPPAERRRRAIRQ